MNTKKTLIEVLMEKIGLKNEILRPLNEEPKFIFIRKVRDYTSEEKVVLQNAVHELRALEKEFKEYKRKVKGSKHDKSIITEYSNVIREAKVEIENLKKLRTTYTQKQVRA